jgi:LysR family transcriptional regulator, cell division regulator
MNQYISSLRIPEIISRYYKEYPNVELSLFTSTLNELLYKIFHFQLDGAFIKAISFHDNNITSELIYEENLVLIANSRYNDIKEICSKSFLMNTAGCPDRIRLEEWLNSEGISNIRYLEFNNTDSIIDGVKADLGASFVPLFTVKTLIEKGQLKSFTVPAQYCTAKIFFIRHKDSMMTSALSKFIDKVKETNMPAYSNL